MSNEEQLSPELVKLGVEAMSMLGELSLNDMRDLINKTVKPERALELALAAEAALPKGLTVEEKLAAAVTFAMFAIFDYAAVQAEEGEEASATEPRLDA
jgi:hypothetical protein